MVKITGYALRSNNEGNSFFALILQGGVEIVKSANGNSYATVKTASIPSTFDEPTCKALIGMEIPGCIQKVQCDPYEYTIQQTGEVVLLNHRHEYVEWEFKQDNKPSDAEVVEMA